MELCTAVKGRALLRLMKEEPSADIYAYLDPDVYVYNDLSTISEYLEGYSIGLVPHILKPEKTEIGIQLTEISVLNHGIYNLGHLFVRSDKNGIKMAEWWAKRLDRYCFDDKDSGLFTDQRWMDLVPSIFDGVKIMKVPNLDVASWNIAYRKLIQKEFGNEKSYEVDGYPLITYHFSGTGPSGTHRKIREIFDPGGGVIAEIERNYENIIDNFDQQRLMKIPPLYNFFDNGNEISSQARKLYRLNLDLQENFSDPFDTIIQKNYYEWFLERQPGLLKGYKIDVDNLENAFDKLFDEDFYLSSYPDVEYEIEAGEYSNALEHYINVGSHLLYDPCEFFISRYYLNQAKNLDIYRSMEIKKKKNTTILWHYLEFGLKQGIEPIEYFDSQYYIENNPDVKKALILGNFFSPLEHFLKSGALELRKPSESFDNNSVANAIKYDEKVDRGIFGAFVRERLTLWGRGA